MRGGDIPQTQVRLREGHNVVEWQVGEYDGFAGVSISTDHTLYAVPLEEESTLIGGPWSHQDAQLTALAAGVSIGLVSIIVVFRRIIGKDEQPERIA